MKILWHRRSERRVGGLAVTEVKQRKGWRIRCDLGKAAEGLENELRRRWSDRKVKEWALHLRHSSFYNHSFASPTSQDLHLRHLSSRPWCGTLVTRSPMGPKSRKLNQAQSGGFLSYTNPGFIKDILKYSQNWCYTIKSRYDPIVKAILYNWI